MAAFDRITFRGHTFDRITADAVLHAESFLPKGTELHIAQGPYSRSVSASANTHAGSGAVDISRCHDYDAVEKAFRLAGWAAWHRYPSSSWEEHVHAVLIGDPNLDPSAKRQVQDYYAHQNGLVNHAYDGHWRPKVIVPFTYPLPYVSLATVQKQARSATPSPKGAVKLLQNALNVKSGAHLSVDGVYGPITKAAMKRWERHNGGDGDGIPGALTKVLGAALFSVTD